MSRLKVVHITQALGGVKTLIENIFEYGDKETFEFVVIAPADKDFQEFCRIRNIKYYPIKLQRSINPVIDTIVLFKIIAILRKEKPAVTQTHSAKGGFIGRLAAKSISTKVIYTPNAFSYLSFTGIKRVIFYMLEYIARNWADVLLAVSFSEAARARFELGIKKERVTVIPNSIFVDELMPVKDYTKIFRINMIGRLTYQKNPLLFLEIAARLSEEYPNLIFSILGAGVHDHLADEIQKFIVEKKLEKNLEIISWGDSSTSKKFISDSDIFVMTSVFEGLPFSLLEAMSMAVPCVVSKVDGNTDVIQNNENGFACISPDEFCDKIKLLIDDEELRKKIGQAGWKYVNQNHNIKKNIRDIEACYSN